jgi:hypothetical protein
MSAAASIYPNLPSGTPEPVKRRQTGSIAEALYPRPKPPLKNPYLEPMTESEWRDQLWELAGLRKPLSALPSWSARSPR